MCCVHNQVVLRSQLSFSNIIYNQFVLLSISRSSVVTIKLFNSHNPVVLLSTIKLLCCQQSSSYAVNQVVSLSQLSCSAKLFCDRNQVVVRHNKIFKWPFNMFCGYNQVVLLSISRSSVVLIKFYYCFYFSS